MVLDSESDSDAFAGSIGFVGGLGASVAYISDTSETTADVRGEILNADDLEVTATSTRDEDVSTVGAGVTAGLTSIAAGASVAMATADGSTKAYVGGGVGADDDPNTTTVAVSPTLAERTGS